MLPEQRIDFNTTQISKLWEAIKEIQKELSKIKKQDLNDEVRTELKGLLKEIPSYQVDNVVRYVLNILEREK